MINFLKPSLWKIILFIVFLILNFFLLSLYLSFTGMNLGCPLNISLPNIAESPFPSSSPSTMPSPQPSIVLYEPSATPAPYTFVGTIQQLPNAITHNYNTCNPPSGSLAAAKTIVNGAYLPFTVIISYILSFGIVTLITKLKNIKKK